MMDKKENAQKENTFELEESPKKEKKLLDKQFYIIFGTMIGAIVLFFIFYIYFEYHLITSD